MTNALPESLDVDLDAWDAWDPREAAQHLGEISAPWYVAAGWALDLFLGRQTRDHDDLELGVPEQRFGEVQHALAGFELVVVGGGRAWPMTTSALATHHQTWVREPGGPWRVDVFREPWDADRWTFRRDPRVQQPATSAVSRTADGIPYLRPEIVLLFKAKALRPKDELDFATVLPHLNSDRREWLRDALMLVNPGHAWVARLSQTEP